MLISLHEVIKRVLLKLYKIMEDISTIIEIVN